MKNGDPEVTTYLSAPFPFMVLVFLDVQAQGLGVVLLPRLVLS